MGDNDEPKEQTSVFGKPGSDWRKLLHMLGFPSWKGHRKPFNPVVYQPSFMSESNREWVVSRKGTSLLGPQVHPREMNVYVHKKIYKQTFMATLFIMAPNWNPTKYPSAGEWINTLWYVHTVEYYSVIKRNELPIHAV